MITQHVLCMDMRIAVTSVRRAAGVKKGRQTKGIRLYEAVLYCRLLLLLLPMTRGNITREPPDCKCVVGDVAVGGCLGHSDHEMVEFKISHWISRKQTLSCSGSCLAEYPGYLLLRA